MTEKSGFTLTEACVATAAAGTLLALLQPGADAVRDASIQEEDAAHVRLIVLGHIAWADLNGGKFPLPSDVDELGTTIDVDQLANPKAAVQLDTISNRMSMLIWQGLVATETPVSPAETRDSVKDYRDFSFTEPPAAEEPFEASWDPTFHGTPLADYNVASDVNPPGVSNNSYALRPVLGKRGAPRVEDQDAGDAIVGNRGPRYAGDGVNGWALAEGAGGTESRTLRFHGQAERWSGHVGFADGRVEFKTRPDPEDLVWSFAGLPEGARQRRDNLFQNEDADGNGRAARPIDEDATLDGQEHFQSEGASANAYLRPVASVEGSSESLGEVHVWID